ncbi:GEVED domain-containing protein [Aquimarina muelleri]|uniref:GEVED domain-containing protein n=1 Tax=Aquimarina muelleri TaxID=279356 RepID=UPI003F6878AB
MTNSIKVYPSNTNSYCTATNNGGGNDIHITQVTLGTFENVSGYTTLYQDYTSLAAVIRTNQNTVLDIKAQNEQWSYNALGIWIDWNQDGDFIDSGEEVFRKYGPGPYNKQIIPPSGAKLGTTRMRVRLSYGAESYIVPCGAQNSIGEIEDYSIIVTNEQAPINTPPVITLLKPSNGQNFVQKENISVETVIKDDGKIEKAELKIDGLLIATDYVAPYQWSNLNKLNFLAPGQREVTITAYDDQGATSSKTVMLTIEKAPITFCDASNGDGLLHITQVIFGTINNSTAHSPYSDHTNLSTVVQKGQQIPLTIKTINESWTYNAIGAWVDWNQDGDFIDTDEEVFSLYGPGPYNGTVTVPSFALTGTPLRMRVRMGYGSKDKINPCGNDTYLGEVEDYIIYVGNTTTPTCNDGIQNGDETGIDCGGSCNPCANNNGVIYVNINDITVSSSNTWEFFRIETGDDTGYGAWYSNNSIRLVTYNKDIVCLANSNNVTLIGEGVEINSSNNFVADPNSYNISTSNYTSWNGKSGFIGFTFKINGNTHYGWFHISVANNGLSYTILDYAYNTNANQTIVTKVMPNVKGGNNSQDTEVTLFPNPFLENFEINTSKLKSDNLEVRVYDIHGKLLIHDTYTKNPNKIRIGDQIKTSGHYFVKIKTETKVKVLKVLKF